ncbi:HAD-superfamily hydrolase [Listeria aquatica FSL S10-1188]|uniref:HAD-superfamily hydrolase n=1 Tax=Listeria aquatica FSL S10-1188 TaxID=1265818 RepID=W7ASV7_9LIST|nr:HAD-superfamily hydrolase [Listeria aquatica FSL S10-1188]
MINTIVTDMDGTLLVTKGDQIEANNKAVLLDWQKAGKKTFFWQQDGWIWQFYRLFMN